MNRLKIAAAMAAFADAAPPPQASFYMHPDVARKMGLNIPSSKRAKVKAARKQNRKRKSLTKKEKS